MISLERCQEIADSIADEYNYPRCVVKFSSRMRNTWAYIRTGCLTITLNFNFVQINSDENMIRDLLKHEFAHIGTKRGHGSDFAKSCEKMNIPVHTHQRHATKSVETYIYVCDKCECQKEYMIKSLWFCSRCGNIMRFKENPNITKVMNMNIRRRQTRNVTTKL